MAASRTALLAGGVVVAALVVAALKLGGDTGENQDTVPPVASAPLTADAELASIREATARFKDVSVALAEGYVPDPGNVCEDAAMLGKPAELGGMGIHYFRPDLLGITGPPNPRVNGIGTHTDFTNPGVLIYEPQADGSLELVAVENLAFAEAWRAAGNTEPPSFQNVAYDYMVDDPATDMDEAHMFEAHYDRHVWVHRDNPNGMFAQLNPNVSCAHHQGGGHAHP